MRLPPVLIAIALVGMSTSSLDAQENCLDGRVSRILIENHSIFDPEAMPDEGRLSWAYEMANRVHMRTRPNFLRNVLLFEEGDCFDVAAAAETGRLLREYRFIAQADVSSIRQPDGDHHVVVRTRDEWTTKLTLNVDFRDGVRFGGGSLFEENLAGRGITLGGFFVRRDEQRDHGMAVEVPNVGRRYLDALLQARKTRGGGALSQAFIRPFQGEQTGYALRQSTSWWNDYFSYTLPPGQDFSHVLVPLRTQRFEFTAAGRIGSPGALILMGGGPSFERIVVDEGPGIEGIRDRDFTSREPVESSVSDRLRPHTVSRNALRMNLFVGLRRLEFEVLRGLDAVGGVHDQPVGYEATITVGRSVGATGSERPGDLHSRFALLAASVRSDLVRQFHLTLEGRREDSGAGDVGGWRDVLLEAEALFYLFPSISVPQTMVIRGAVHGGWRTTSPFQLTLGGSDGVRGYTEMDFPGARRGLLSLETRLASPNPFPEFADLGITAFADLGTMQGGSVPFGEDSGWRGSVGAGVRVGFPAGSASVIRADVAFPLGPGASDRSPVFRISAREWIGVTRDVGNPQLERSRTSGIQGDYLGAARSGGRER